MNPLTLHPKDGNYVLFVKKISKDFEDNSELAKTNLEHCIELENSYIKENRLTYYTLSDEISEKYPSVIPDDIRLIAPNAKDIRPLSLSDLQILFMYLFKLEYEKPDIIKLSFNQRQLALDRVSTEMRDQLAEAIFKVCSRYFMEKKDDILRCFSKDYEPKFVENGIIYPFSSWLLKHSLNSVPEIKFKITNAFHYTYKD